MATLFIGKEYRNFSVRAVAYLFVLLFVYAAISKLLDFETFTVQLAQSPLLSAYAGFIAWAVPGIEIAIALLLVFERFRLFALYAAFTLMVMFTAYIYIILNFSDFVPCSCGGVLEKLSWTQHLIFNVVFIILAGTGIFLFNGNNKKTILLFLAFLGVGIVTLLFAFSEKKMQRNNAFQRRFIPHPTALKAVVDLKYDSYYIAGLTNKTIYLGNVTAPLKILEFDTELNAPKNHIIKLDAMELPYSRIHLAIEPPYFYVSDGNVPIILRGDVSNWNAQTVMHNQIYFSQLAPIDTNHIVVRTIDGKTRKQILASYVLHLQKLRVNDELLKTERGSIFDVDGQLLYDPTTRKVIYSYYYRNQFLVFDDQLKIDFYGKTIDTISQPQLEIIHNSTTDKNKLKGNAIVVNKQAAVSGNKLYIISERLGKYEDSKSLKRATIIDVYNLSNNTYEFSFYLYDYKNKKVSSFRVHENQLYALLGDYLIKYQLNETYFKK